MRVFREQFAWLVEKSLHLLRQQTGKAFCSQLTWGFGVPRSEELEVNQWIVQDIHWLSSQSERAKNTIHCFSIYSLLLLILPCVHAQFNSFLGICYWQCQSLLSSIVYLLYCDYSNFLNHGHCEWDGALEWLFKWIAYNIVFLSSHEREPLYPLLRFEICK